MRTSHLTTKRLQLVTTSYAQISFHLTLFTAEQSKYPTNCIPYVIVTCWYDLPEHLTGLHKCNKLCCIAVLIYTASQKTRQLWQAVSSTSMNQFWQFSVNSISTVSKMICVLNFPCTMYLQFYLLHLLLNSCDRNDAKQRVFLGRLLVALNRAGCVVCALWKEQVLV